jgi:hypothetical protein
MEDSTDQREFAKDLIDAGYKTFGSEEENQILRKHNLSRDESLSNDKNRVYKDNTSGKAYVLYPGRKDKKDIAEMVKLDSEVIPINVGGTHHMMTERDVLRLVPGSTLEKMFSGLHELKKIDEEVFLDRDGRTF